MIEVMFLVASDRR